MMNYGVMPYNESNDDNLDPDFKHPFPEPFNLEFEESNFMTYQPFYDFATSGLEQRDVYTYSIPQDDLDAASLLPQWEMIQLVYIDLRWNGGDILNSMYTALGDCINQNYEVERCQYQQGVIQQIYGENPMMDKGNVPYSGENNQNFTTDFDPYNQNENWNGYNPNNPFNFV